MVSTKNVIRVGSLRARANVSARVPSRGKPLRASSVSSYCTRCARPVDRGTQWRGR